MSRIYHKSYFVSIFLAENDLFLVQTLCEANSTQKTRNEAVKQSKSIIFMKTKTLQIIILTVSLTLYVWKMCLDRNKLLIAIASIFGVNCYIAQ